MTGRRVRGSLAAALGALLALSGCSLDVTDLPLPGGADVGQDPYEVTIEFDDVLDLVPQSAVRVDDIAVGKVTEIELDGWHAVVTVQINNDVELPANAIATIRQTSLLGEKFVSLAPPPVGASGQLGDGDEISLTASGRNTDIEEVLGAASLLFNGGGLEKTNTIVRELNATLGGNETEVKELLQTTTTFLGTLDTNKERILTALEQIDALSVAANDQRDAITGALDELPAALRVLEDQRDEFTRLTQALGQLGDTATGVIAATREDTIANLRALEPVLANLAVASDDLVGGLSTLLTFPFSDAIVGGSLEEATAMCEQPSSAPAIVDTPVACNGDFVNLAIDLPLSTEQLCNLIGALDLIGLCATLTDLTTGALPGLSAVPGLPGAGEAPSAGAGANELVGFLEQFFAAPTGASSPQVADPLTGVPGQLSELVPQPSPSASTAAPAADTSLLCRLFAVCSNGGAS